MALTLRSNGVAGGLVSAAWWNDYYNLLTGSMSDQYITINNSMTLKGILASPTAPTLALTSGTSTGIGSYTYAIGFFEGDMQSLPGTTAVITTTSGNQKVSLTAIPTGPAGTAGRYIWRSKVGTSSPLYLAGTINDNTTTTFTDSAADASLTTLAPSHSSFGGSLIIKDQTGAVNATIFKDGAVMFDAGNITSNASGFLTLVGLIIGSGLLNLPAKSQSFNGSTSGTLTVNEYFVGASSLKVVVLYANNYKNAGSLHNFALNQAFSTGFGAVNLGAKGFSFLVSGSTQNVTIMTSLSSSGGGTATQATLPNWSIGQCIAAVDTVQEPGGNASASSGMCVLIGY